MLVLIDECGCPGFKLGKGSTAYFTVGMVIFDDLKEAERASAAIQAARKALRVAPEFKFSNCSADVRDRFFAAVNPYRFSVRAIVIEKAEIYSANLRSSTDRFYNFTVKMLLQHDGGALEGASVKIDRSGDREFQKTLGGYLRREAGAGKITKIKFVDSKGDNLVQLADMVTGAIARSYTGRQDAGRWRSQIKSKIQNVWDFR